MARQLQVFRLPMGMAVAGLPTVHLPPANASAVGADDSSVALALVDSVAVDDSLKELLRSLISDKQKMQSSLQSLQHELTEAKTKADRREQVSRL